MLSYLVNSSNTVMFTLMCIILQCLVIFDWGVNAADEAKSAQKNQEIKTADAISLVKNDSTISIAAEILNRTTPAIVSNDTLRHMPHDSRLSPGAVLRGFYVFVVLGAIVVMYIVIRTIRLRRKKTTVRKYGILASREDVEMTPLGAEDEDEDTTLFDVNNHSRP